MTTRVLYVAAALLAATALTLPLWGFSMFAPQYPDETLHLKVVWTGIAGDVHEVSALQQYIGVRFPADLPELTWAGRGIAALVLLLLVAVATGTGLPGRVYRTVCALMFLAFLVAAAGGVQARLYQVGHDRDPRAPLRSIRDFTPPLIGWIKVGNFTVWSYPHAGAVLLLGAAALSAVGARRGASVGAVRRSQAVHLPDKVIA
jgi:copper chaperone NosL